jgi:hypothetical protein
MTSVLNDQETSILLALKAKADAGSPTGAIEVTPEQTEIMRKAYLAIVVGVLGVLVLGVPKFK